MVVATDVEMYAYDLCAKCHGTKIPRQWTLSCLLTAAAKTD